MLDYFLETSPFLGGLQQEAVMNSYRSLAGEEGKDICFEGRKTTRLRLEQQKGSVHILTGNQRIAEQRTHAQFRGKGPAVGKVFILGDVLRNLRLPVQQGSANNPFLAGDVFPAQHSLHADRIQSALGRQGEVPPLQSDNSLGHMQRVGNARHDAVQDHWQVDRRGQNRRDVFEFGALAVLNLDVPADLRPLDRRG